MRRRNELQFRICFGLRRFSAALASFRSNRQNVDADSQRQKALELSKWEKIADPCL